MNLKNCPVCGETIQPRKDETPTQYNRRVNCSKACAVEAQTKRGTKECTACHKTYDRPNNYHRRNWERRTRCFTCQPMQSHYTQGRDYVPTSRIQPYIIREIESGTKMESIVKMTGILERRLYDVLKCRTKSTSFRTADKIITGLGCPEAWHHELADIYHSIEL